MDRPEKPKAPGGNYPDTQCARERSAGVLRNRARRFHEYAVSLEKLADWAAVLNEAQDEALWNILEGFTPR
jgi:hypothetical protein